MRYQRPTERKNGFKEFEVGTHAATITKIDRKKSSSENDMFVLSLEGKNDEKGRAYLTFGNDYTEETLSFILCSIEDNGVEIPEINFGYNRDTFNFLNNKEVYIRVELKKYNGELRPNVTQFLTLQEFEDSAEENKENQQENDNW